MNKKFLSALIAASMLIGIIPAAYAGERAEIVSVTTISAEKDDSASYSLYMKDSYAQLSDDRDKDKDNDKSDKKPKGSEAPSESESPAISESPSESKFPKYYNSNELGYITSVKNQIVDGDCWAFASTSAFESSLIKHGMVKDASKLDLSEKHMTDNTYFNEENPWSFDYTSMGHKGVPVSYYSRGTGPVSDTGNGNDVSSYNTDKYGVNTNIQSEFYADSIKTVPNLVCLAEPVTDETKVPEIYDKAKVFGDYKITDPDEITEDIINSSYIMKDMEGYNLYKVGFYDQMNLVKKEIIENGSIYTTISTGVAPNEDGTNNFDEYFFNSETNAFYNYIFSEKDHAVTIVGWDDDFSKENFVNPPEKDGAWIVKNSWGKEMLDNGYMYVSYYDTKICEDIVSFSAAQLGNVEKIFQHDPFGFTGDMRFTVNLEESPNAQLWALNRFENPITEDQYVTHVGVFTVLPETICNIYIASNEKNTGDNIGGKSTGEKDGFRNMKALKTVKFDIPGYYRIELDEPVKIWGDFEVAVRYEFENPDDPAELHMPVEMMGADNNSKSGADKKGESYYAIEHGERFAFIWTDMFNEEQGRGNNACIKAFTSIKTSDSKYEVEPFSITDMSGNALNEMPKNGSFLVGTTVKKTDNRIQPDYMIIASYDSEGAFVNFSYLLLPKEMEIGDSRSFGCMISPPEGKSINAVKAFVWSSFTNLTPISNCIEIKAEKDDNTDNTQ